MRLLRTWPALAATFGLVAAWCVGRPAATGEVHSVAYALTPHPASAGSSARTHLAVDVAGVDLGRLRFRMPRWTPGEYRLQHHGRYVESVSSRIGDTHASVRRDDDSSWSVDAGESDRVRFEYDLPNVPAGVFTENANVSARHAFYSGPATFVMVEAGRHAPVRLEVTAPEGWTPALSPLKRVGAAGPAAGGASFSADSYDALVDAPLLVGDRETRSFRLHGVEHTVAFFGRRRARAMDDWVDAFRRVAGEAAAYFGQPTAAPYILFIDVDGRGGGLEHADSARIAFSSSGSLTEFAVFAAHEYAHRWNVKRLRPAEFGVFDYERPTRTVSLWFLEGATEYCARMVARRSGVISDEQFLGLLSASISELQSTPARLRVTAEEASRNAWATGDSRSYRGLSYYLKGEMIALCLDLALRRETGGRCGLEDVVRHLVRTYSPPNPGYTDADLRKAFAAVGGSVVGGIYDLAVRTTQELPLPSCVGAVGLALAPGAGGACLVDDHSAPSQSADLRRAWLEGR